MMYVLTEQEFNELRTAKTSTEKLDTKNLQRLCTLAAQHIPIAKERNPGANPTPWGCIHTKETEYCDNCPVQSICPTQFKDWSK